MGDYTEEQKQEGLRQLRMLVSEAGYNQYGITRNLSPEFDFSYDSTLVPSYIVWKATGFTRVKGADDDDMHCFTCFKLRAEHRIEEEQCCTQYQPIYDCGQHTNHPANHLPPTLEEYLDQHPAARLRQRGTLSDVRQHGPLGPRGSSTGGRDSFPEAVPPTPQRDTRAATPAPR